MAIDCRQSKTATAFGCILAGEMISRKSSRRSPLAFSKIKASSFILDGEAVAVDAQGKPSFQMLQNRSSLPPGWSLAYYCFDLLHLNGEDLKHRPLQERRALLEKLLGKSGVLLSQSL